MLSSLFEDLGKLILEISLGTLSSSIIILFLAWKIVPSSFKYLAAFLVWNFIIEVTAFLLVQNEINNLPLLHLYTLGEFILFSIYYRQINLKPTFFTKIVFIVVSVLLIILNSVFLQNIDGFNSNAKTFVQVIIIINAIIFFYQNSIESEAEDHTIRLVNSAILIYYSGSLFIFMFSDYFQRLGEGIHINFWVFNALLNLIFQILILIAIWRTTQSKKSLSS